MTLSNLTTTLIELGLPEKEAMNLEMAHNRHIRTSVDNTPSISRIASFMEDFRDEHGDEMTDLALANGAIMYFSRAKLANVEFAGKFKERLAKNEFVKETLVSFQALSVRPEYDELSVPEEMFEL